MTQIGSENLKNIYRSHEFLRYPVMRETLREAIRHPEQPVAIDDSFRNAAHEANERLQGRKVTTGNLFKRIAVAIRHIWHRMEHWFRMLAPLYRSGFNQAVGKIVEAYAPPEQVPAEMPESGKREGGKSEASKALELHQFLLEQKVKVLKFINSEPIQRQAFQELLQSILAHEYLKENPILNEGMLQVDFSNLHAEKRRVFNEIADLRVVIQQFEQELND